MFQKQNSTIDDETFTETNYQRMSCNNNVNPVLIKNERNMFLKIEKEKSLLSEKS